MRTAEYAHPSPNHAHDARLQLARIAMAIIATALLLLVWHPVVLKAQSKPDTATTTHIVKSGETLWSIATRYYGDGHQWRALARRNGVATNGETAIVVGMKLVVPAKRVVATAKSTSAMADTTVPKAATAPAAPAPERPTPTPTPERPAPTAALVPKPKSGQLASQTSSKADAAEKAAASKGAAARKPSAATPAKRGVAEPSVATAADARNNQDSIAMTARGALIPTVKSEQLMTRGPSRVGLLDAGALRAARARNETPTIFTREVPDEAEAMQAIQTTLKRSGPAPRRGEYLAAPYPIATARWLKAGRIVRRLDAAAPSAGVAEHLQLADQVEIEAPLGVTLAVGDQLVVLRGDSTLSTGARVGVPAGVLQVTQMTAGKPVRAVVRSLSGSMQQGQSILPVEGAAGPAGVQLTPVSGKDVETKVTWLEDGALLPSLQSYLMLSAGDAQGVKPGDEFALVAKTANGVEERVAVVRIVRSGALGSTGIVVKQSGPEIVIGAVARRIARAP